MSVRGAQLSPGNGRVSAWRGGRQLEVASQGDEPVFVGIARTEDVVSYLRGVDHTQVADVDADPFGRVEASYQRVSGNRRPAAPARESFWAASTQGRSTQTLDWRVKDGDWSVVVMNADSSRRHLTAGHRAQDASRCGRPKGSTAEGTVRSGRTLSFRRPVSLTPRARDEASPRAPGRLSE